MHSGYTLILIVFTCVIARGFAALELASVFQIFNYRIYPTIPFGIRGVLWYQGETNANDPLYALKQQTLIESWRELWGYDFPFYYGQADIVVSGPLFKSASVEGRRVRITFDHVALGLTKGRQPSEQPFEATPEALMQGFQIAGADQVWHKAEASISGEAVIVSSSVVSDPLAVRYAFSQNPADANLYNKAALPASPFPTDEWAFEMVE